MRYFVTGLMAATLIFACSNESLTPTSTMNGNIAKVSVAANGTISLNGSEASIEDVRATFAKLSQNSGQVWYYREAA